MKRLFRHPGARLAFKAAIVFGLMALLVQRGLLSLSLEHTRAALSRWENTGPALLVFLITAALGALRWHWLLQAQGFTLPFRRTAELTFVGNFFNIALPGAVSGDFVKAVYVGREVEGRRGHAFGSILFDRVAGVAALVLLSAGALLTDLGDYRGSNLLEGVEWVLALAAGGVVAFFAYLFLVSERRDPVLALLVRAERRFPRAGSVRRIYEGLRHYHAHRGAVLRVLGVSVLIHLLVGWAAWNFLIALDGQPEARLRDLYVIVPLGLLVTAVPVLPAGVGTGHAAFYYLFRLLGSERGADVFTLIAGSNILVGLLGGLVYLRFRAALPPGGLASAAQEAADGKSPAATLPTPGAPRAPAS